MKQELRAGSDGSNLSKNALEYLTSKYLLRNEHGHVIEDPDQMFRRLAISVAKAEQKYGNDPSKVEEAFYNIVSGLEFLPTSPGLMSAGTPEQQFSSTYVVPIILPEVTAQAISTIQVSGGGVGYSLNSFSGSSQRLIDLMRLFDRATLSVKQCGRRQGCNMAVMRVDHPLVRSFISSRRDGSIPNTGISVLLTDEFMHAAENNEDCLLRSEGRVVGRENASDILDEISSVAWNAGEPGVLFVDEINRHNPTPQLGKIEAVSPCAVMPLFPNEAAVMGSINLARFTDGHIDFDALGLVTRQAVRFLDNALTVNKFPTQQTECQSLLTRKIGIGIMGLADVFARMKIAYGSPASIRTTESIMNYIQEQAKQASAELARERGSYPIHRTSDPDRSEARNATVTAIAPTGSISVIAGCWGGIEPYYGLPGDKRVLDDLVLCEENKLKSEALKDSDLFKSAHEIPSDEQVAVVAALQKHVDNAIAKTVTLPHDATVDDVRKTFILAWKQRCKGITVFRVGCINGTSRPSQ